jgi:hypothetical protein
MSNADSIRALRDMMMSGSGRAVLESQILQEHSIQRLLAIVRGEELPPRPEPKTQQADEPSATEQEETSGESAVGERESEEEDKEEDNA